MKVCPVGWIVQQTSLQLKFEVLKVKVQSPGLPGSEGKVVVRFSSVI